MMLKLLTSTAIALLPLTGCADNHTDRSTNSSSATPMSEDARILSTLHAANQEEIAMGQLARERGASLETRRFGDMLVMHHTDADTRVKQTADAAGIVLSSTSTAKERDSRSNAGSRSSDDLAAMRALSGTSFDQAFAAKMAEGHRTVIEKVESARTLVQNDRVRRLLDELLPTLRQHEQTALSLQSR